MSVGPTTMRLPREGTTIRLVGLRSSSLNGAEGKIAGYTRDNERVMVALLGDGGVVKVKPKQIQLIEKQSSSGRRSGRSVDGHRRSSNQSRRPSMRKLESNTSLQGSDSGNAILDTLKSADEMFDLADRNGNGWLSFDEFEYYMTRHTKHSKEMIRDVFRMIDRDGDGEVSKEEVRANFFKRRREALEKNGASTEGVVSDDVLLHAAMDADKMFDRADTSGDGEVSWREFQLYMSRHTNHGLIVIAELFSMMDVSNDGYLSREEVRRCFLRQKQKQKGQDDKISKINSAFSLGDLMGLEDDEMDELSDDVYSMFFLSNLYSQAFFYAILIFLLKQSLIIVIAFDLLTNKSFPPLEDVPKSVRVTQLLLMPVNFALQEELVTTYYIYGNVKWDKVILELSPGAYKWKYHVGNLFRFLDGISFLFINTVLLLQATDILGMFLNFAALQFLQSIDNVALNLAKDGYLSEPLEEVAGKVHFVKLPKNNNSTLQLLDSCLMFSTSVLLVVAWVMKMMLT